MVYETGWRTLYINWIHRLRYDVRFVSFTITMVSDTQSELTKTTETKLRQMKCVNTVDR